MIIMENIKSANILWLKGGLFALLGVIASVLLLIQSPTWKVGLLLAVAIWAFCRAYYFAFYVIGQYIDPAYKFSGLGSFVVHALRKRREM
jgi:hypothetical protein